MTPNDWFKFAQNEKTPLYLFYATYNDTLGLVTEVGKPNDEEID